MEQGRRTLAACLSQASASASSSEARWKLVGTGWYSGRLSALPSLLQAKKDDGVTRLLPAQPNAVARQALEVLKQSRLQEQQQEQQQQRMERARYLQQAVPAFRPIPGAEGGPPLMGVAVMASPAMMGQAGYQAGYQVGYQAGGQAGGQAIYASSPNQGYSNLAAASRWNTTRPLRLAAVPPFQQLPTSISRVANVGPASNHNQVSAGNPNRRPVILDCGLCLALKDSCVGCIELSCDYTDPAERDLSFKILFDICPAGRLPALRVRCHCCRRPCSSARRLQERLAGGHWELSGKAEWNGVASLVYSRLESPVQ